MYVSVQTDAARARIKELLAGKEDVLGVRLGVRTRTWVSEATPCSPEPSSCCAWVVWMDGWMDGWVGGWVGGSRREEGAKPGRSDAMEQLTCY